MRCDVMPYDVYVGTQLLLLIMQNDILTVTSPPVTATPFAAASERLKVAWVTDDNAFVYSLSYDHLISEMQVRHIMDS